MPPKGDPRFEFFEGEDLARNRESGIFYMVKAMKGFPPIFNSTGQTDKRKAKKEFPRIIKKHLEKHQDGKREPGSSPTVSEVIEEVLTTNWTHNRKPLRAKTKRKRKFYFGRIRDLLKLGHFPMDRVTLRLFTDRVDQQRAMPPPKKGKHRKTFGDDVKHMNILFRFAYAQRYVSHLVSFPNPDTKSDAGTVLTLPELRLLWDVMGETTRDQFVLGYGCAMRKLEALHLTWDRIDLETGQIILRAEDVKTGSKTGKGREFYITTQALERLRARKALQEAEGYMGRWVFPSETGKGPITDNKTAWAAAKERALKKMPVFQHWARWHDLRHTAITRMLVEQGINITKVSEYVGTSVATLQRVYLHSTAEHTRGVSEGLRITDAEPT